MTLRRSSRCSITTEMKSAVPPKMRCDALVEIHPSASACADDIAPKTEATSNTTPSRRLSSPLLAVSIDTDVDVPTTEKRLTVAAARNGSPTTLFRTGTRKMPPPSPRTDPSAPAPIPAAIVMIMVQFTARPSSKPRRETDDQHQQHERSGAHEGPVALPDFFGEHGDHVEDRHGDEHCAGEPEHGCGRARPESKPSNQPINEERRDDTDARAIKCAVLFDSRLVRVGHRG